MTTGGQSGRTSASRPHSLHGSRTGDIKPVTKPLAYSHSVGVEVTGLLLEGGDEEDSEGGVGELC